MSHWQSLTKIRPADTKFSIYVRMRDRKCAFGVRCIPRELTNWDTGELDIRGLQCCHFIGRRNEAVRFDPENGDAGCPKCHDWIDKTPEGQRWHKAFKIKQLGEKGFALLQLRANTKGNKDDKLTMLYIKQLMSEL